MLELPTGAITFLFIDIEGRTALVGVPGAVFPRTWTVNRPSRPTMSRHPRSRPMTSGPRPSHPRSRRPESSA